MKFQLIGRKCSNEGSEGSCCVSGLAMAVPRVPGGGGGRGLDVLLHHAQLLAQAQRPVLALAVAGGGDLETITVTVTIIYIPSRGTLSAVRTSPLSLMWAHWTQYSSSW